jgi:hypothetical protein
MKKFILSAMIMLMVAGAADAQRPYRNARNQHQKAVQRQARQQVNSKAQLYSQLNMSAYQRSQADQLNHNLESGLQSMRYNNRLSKQQKQYALQSMVQQHQSGFRSILSPSQSQQYASVLGNNSYDQSTNNLDLSSVLGGNTSGSSSALGNYGWLLSLLGNNLKLGSILGRNFDLGSLLGLFTR